MKEKSKRMRARRLVEAVPAVELDDLLWLLMQYAAPGLNAKHKSGRE